MLPQGEPALFKQGGPTGSGKPLTDASMNVSAKSRRLRVVCVPVISAVAILLAAAAFDPEANWARLRAFPNDHRAKLVENIKKFDLLYKGSEQAALRDLDRKINELPAASRAHYLDALARYHNWVNQLPENKQAELTALPAAERMAAVKKLLQDYPLERPTTARFLRRVDLGEYSPFEIASLFLIWQALAPEKRREIERLPAVQGRHAAMYKTADAKGIPHEVTLPDFDEASAAKRFEEFARANRPALLLSELRKKKEGIQAERAAEILRRQAINYYFSEHQPKSVAPERLSQFLAALPPWLQSAFDPHPPEEAQRRLAIVYRLVFPHPAEIKPPQKPAAAAPGARPPADGAAGPAPAPAGPPSRTGNNPF
jgi:hypothetical protein